MKRILHVVGIMDRAGAETMIMNIYRTVDRSRLQFDFLCVLPRKGDYEDEILSLGGKVFHLGRQRIRIPFLHYLSKIHYYSVFFKYHPEYHIVHFHNSHACSVVIQLAGAVAGNVIHKIVHSHNTSAPVPLLHTLFRPLIRCFDIHRMACSTDAAIWMFGKRVKDTLIIKNGIPIDKFAFQLEDREKIREELALSGKKVILHVGRFSPQKNHAFIIQVFREIVRSRPDTHLLLAGDGELLEVIKEMTEKNALSDKVTFLGNRKDIPALLSASDIFLFPSLFEGLSVVLIEAQTNGISILTTTNLAKETIFSSHVRQLSTDELPQRWAEEAIRLIEEYPYRNIASEVSDNGFDIKTIARDLQQYYLQMTGT